MSTISAGLTSGTALVSSGDTTGTLVFQTNGTTTALTLGTDQSATFAGNVVVSGSIAVPSPFTVTGNSTAGAEIRLPEDTDNGSNYVALKSPNSLASNLTFTLPTADGTNGQYLRTDGAGQLSFATVPTTSPAGSTGQLQINSSGSFGAVSSGTSGQFLISQGAGASPTWLTTVPIANGGTNSSATPTAGAVAYGTGSAFAFTSAGTSGQVLRSNGAGAPSWTTISSGWTQLSSQTASGANIVFSIPGGYNDIYFVLDGLSLTTPDITTISLSSDGTNYTNRARFSAGSGGSNYSGGVLITRYLSTAGAMETALEPLTAPAIGSTVPSSAPSVKPWRMPSAITAVRFSPESFGSVSFSGGTITLFAR